MRLGCATGTALSVTRPSLTHSLDARSYQCRARRTQVHGCVAHAEPISRRDAVLALTAATAAVSIGTEAHAGGALSVYDFAPLQYREPVDLSKYRRKNSNYPGLRMLLEKYGGTSGQFDVLAFPCNQFGGQAPLGSEGERTYAYKKFGIDTFPVFDTIDVNGDQADPLYKFLKKSQPKAVPGARFALSAEIGWNYEKFLIDCNGIPVKRYNSPFNPADAESDLRLVLAGKAPLPEECVMHPGRRVCKVENLL